MDNVQTSITNEDIMIFKSGKTTLTLDKNDTNIDILISILQNLKSKKKKD